MRRVNVSPIYKKLAAQPSSGHLFKGTLNTTNKYPRKRDIEGTVRWPVTSEVIISAEDLRKVYVIGKIEYPRYAASRSA
jgi:hypothetical protein